MVVNNILSCRKPQYIDPTGQTEQSAEQGTQNPVPEKPAPAREPPTASQATPTGDRPESTIQAIVEEPPAEKQPEIETQVLPIEETLVENPTLRIEETIEGQSPGDAAAKENQAPANPGKFHNLSRTLMIPTLLPLFTILESNRRRRGSPTETSRRIGAPNKDRVGRRRRQETGHRAQ